MRKIKEKEELRDAMASYNKGYLFRGQVENYADTEGYVSITTSFTRHGCIPPEMQKWNLYSELILYCLIGPDFKEKVQLEESQALLQHYGWRSFYLDFTRDYGVASWFACNVYNETNHMDIGEDWQENGVLIMRRNATYKESMSDGHLYIVSEEALNDHGIGIHSMDRFRFSDFDSRLDRQAAVMIGPTERLPLEVIVDHFQVDNSVLKEAGKGKSQSFLFPSKDEDLIYKLFLATPFGIPETVKSDFGNFGPYVRSLSIPEYDYEFCKRWEPSTAFYTPKHLINKDKEPDALIIHAPDHFLHHLNIDIPNAIDSIGKMLESKSVIILETAGIVCLPPSENEPSYLKGIYIHKVDEGVIKISGLGVEYPGTICIGILEYEGWHYRLAPGQLERFSHELDCSCNFDRKHLLELTVAKKLNLAIEKKQLQNENGYFKIIA